MKTNISTNTDNEYMLSFEEFIVLFLIHARSRTQGAFLNKLVQDCITIDGKFNKPKVFNIIEKFLESKFIFEIESDSNADRLVFIDKEGKRIYVNNQDKYFHLLKDKM